MSVTAVYEQALPGVVQVVDRARLGQPRVQWSLGSGFVVDREGHVLTSYHVVTGVHDLGVVLGDSQDVVLADLIGEDESHDLALLRVSASAARFHALTLGDSGQLRVGQPVVAIGSPFGLERTATTGIVSHLGRDLDVENGVAIEDAIQTDATINPGNSGGPLLDLRGEVVGVNTAGVQRDLGGFQSGSVGIGFAIPSNRVRDLLPEMTSGALRSRPSLGVVLRDLRPDASTEQGRREGVLVVHVLSGGAADEAGVRGARYALLAECEEECDPLEAAGDVIVAIDGSGVSASADVVARLAAPSLHVGDIVTVRVVRGAEVVDVAIRLRARDASFPGAV